jgi:pseudaminic acid cytidylyltransferase
MKIAIIPARSGSKRIKNKNIIKFNGTPLIVHTIKNLLKAKLFDMIVVSTDSIKIQKISVKAGAKILFKRPKNLSDDFTATSDVINHSIMFLKKMRLNPKFVCCVYPTSIMLNSRDLLKSFAEIEKKKLDFVFSVTDYGHPPQRGFYLKNNKIDIIQKKFFKKRTQDIIKIYHDAGQFYWGKTESWLKKKPFFSKNSYGYKLSRNKIVDLDNKEDLEMLRNIFNIYQNKKNNENK